MGAFPFKKFSQTAPELNSKKYEVQDDEYEYITKVGSDVKLDNAVKQHKKHNVPSGKGLT